MSSACGTKWLLLHLHPPPLPQESGVHLTGSRQGGEFWNVSLSHYQVLEGPVPWVFRRKPKLPVWYKAGGPQ